MKNLSFNLKIKRKMYFKRMVWNQFLVSCETLKMSKIDVICTSSLLLIVPYKKPLNCDLKFCHDCNILWPHNYKSMCVTYDKVLQQWENTKMGKNSYFEIERVRYTGTFKEVALASVWEGEYQRHNYKTSSARFSRSVSLLGISILKYVGFHTHSICMILRPVY